MTISPLELSVVATVSAITGYTVSAVRERSHLFTYFRTLRARYLRRATMGLLEELGRRLDSGTMAKVKEALIKKPVHP